MKASPSHFCLHPETPRNTTESESREKVCILVKVCGNGHGKFQVSLWYRWTGFLRKSRWLSGSVLEDPCWWFHSKHSHNYNLSPALRILLGFFCVWASQQLCHQVEVPTLSSKHFKKITRISCQRKEKCSHALGRRKIGLHLLFEKKIFKNPAQLQDPLMPVLL